MAGTWTRYRAMIGLDKLDGVLNLQKLSNTLRYFSEPLALAAQQLSESFTYAPFLARHIYITFLSLTRTCFILQENMLLIFGDALPDEIEVPDDFFEFSGECFVSTDVLDFQQNLNLNLNLTEKYISPAAFINYMSMDQHPNSGASRKYVFDVIHTGANDTNNRNPSLNQIVEEINTDIPPISQPPQQNNQIELSAEQINNGFNNLQNSQNQLNAQIARINYLQNFQFNGENNTNASDNFNPNRNLDVNNLLVIQQSFWNGLIRNKSSYCQRCGGLAHTNSLVTCPRRCRYCYGPHDTKDCLGLNKCKWCGEPAGPHQCKYNADGINFLTVRCPLCKIRGHVASKCTPEYFAIGSLIACFRRGRRKKFGRKRKRRLRGIKKMKSKPK